jgi:uncharacterized protein YmfQ (DUF2313 family)
VDDVVLNEEQADIVAHALGPVNVRDPRGTVLGRIEPRLTPELIAELRRRARSPGPRYSGAQVQARLQALQAEWDRLGGFDEAYMREFLARLNQSDPGYMRPRDEAG